jgi:glycolate oxidase FAD binding subunit
MTAEPFVTALQARIRDAAHAGITLRVVGSGGWLDAGRPVAAREQVETRSHSGIVGYVPGDLTLTARAGTTLAEIRDATAANNQWLALDPYGDDEGTLGATVATASAGPLATAFGTPRDLVLGVEFVTGSASVVRGGGRVVKNVAGFDLTRLLVGSWGTLGVITEVTVRLHARPASDATIAVPTADVSRVRTLLRRLPFTPYACEVVNDALAHDLLGRAQTTTLFRLGGNADAVAAQRRALAELGDAEEIDGSVWSRMRSAEASGALVLRYSNLPSRIADTWSLAANINGARVTAAPARGVVRLVLPASEPAMPSVSSVPSDITVIAERLGTGTWPVAHAPTGALPARIKAAFDPHNLMNPGILGVES